MCCLCWNQLLHQEYLFNFFLELRQEKTNNGDFYLLGSFPQARRWGSEGVKERHICKRLSCFPGSCLFLWVL